MHTGVQHDFHIRWCSYRLTVTRQVSDVELELLRLPGHTSSFPFFSGVCVARCLVFCVMFCLSLFFRPSVPFPFAIVLSVLLRFTALNTPLGSSHFLFRMIIIFRSNIQCISQFSSNFKRYLQTISKNGYKWYSYT